MKVRLVLSGGAARGISHIGVIKALEDLGFQITALSGVSAGALVAVFYSSGYDPQDMLSLVNRLDWLTYIRPRFPKLGLFSLSKAVKFLESLIPYKNLEDLPIKTSVCCLDIHSGETLYFQKGEIAPITLGSCALPGIFEPVRYKNYHLVDGGITNNLPIEPIADGEGVLIGVDVNPKERTQRASNIIQILIKSFSLAVSSNVEKRKSVCDIVIEPPLHGFNLISVRKAKELYQLGYKATMDVMKNYVK